MGVTKCPKHGKSGSAGVCSHIDAAVKNGLPVTEFKVHECFLDDELAWRHWLCPQCSTALQSKGLPDTRFTIASEEDQLFHEHVFSQVEGSDRGICGSCLRECIALNPDGVIDVEFIPLIRYGGFWDFPLEFYVRQWNDIFIFHRGFDEEADEYETEYQVRLMKNKPDEALSNGWQSILDESEECGMIPVKDVVFDPRHRRFGGADIFSKIKTQMHG